MSTLSNRTAKAGASAPAPPPTPGAFPMPTYRAGPRKRPPTHPGAVAADILDDVGVSARQAAIAIDMTPAGLGKVLNGKGPVTPETALRFGVYFGNGPELWLNLQQDYDLWHARIALAALLKKIEPLKG